MQNDSLQKTEYQKLKRPISDEEKKAIIKEATRELWTGFWYITFFFGLVFILPALFTLIGKGTKSFWILTSLWLGGSLPMGFLWFLRRRSVKKFLEGGLLQAKILASSTDEDLSEEHKSLILKLSSSREQVPNEPTRSIIRFVTPKRSYLGLTTWPEADSAPTKGSQIWIRTKESRPNGFVVATEGLPVTPGATDREKAPKRMILLTFSIAAVGIYIFYILIKNFAK